VRALTLHMTITVDGFIAKPDGTLWDSFPWPDEMLDFTTDLYRGADTAIYGRGAYETIVPWWDNAAEGTFPEGVEVTDRLVELAGILQGITKIVVSRTLNPADIAATLIDGDVVPAVANLKARGGGEIILHAGSPLVAELADSNLIDEYMLFVSPAAIGAGRPLFAGLQRELPLKLIETRVFNSTFTLLRYAPAERRDAGSA
jgi:dihydrofolate reductase